MTFACPIDYMKVWGALVVSIRKKGFSLTERVACVVLAGGQGTRLFPLTRSRCKPAVCFGGRYRLIDVPISNSLNSNMKRVFVISQYFSSGLNRHLQETYHLDQFQGGSLVLLNPEMRPGGRVWYEGTADAVRKNIDLLTKLPVDYFLILSGDQLYNMDLASMILFAHERDSDLTVGVIPVGHVEAPRLGLLNVDREANILDFCEKPANEELLKRFEMPEHFLKRGDFLCSDPPWFLASMGVYVFKKEALIDLLAQDGRNDFGKHVIPSQLERGRSTAFIHPGYWRDIGTISSFYRANLSLTANSLGLNLYNEAFPIYTHNHYLPGARIAKTEVRNSIISDGAVVEARRITRSIIGVRNVIKEGAEIHDSVLLGNEYYSAPRDPSRCYTIGKDCHIERAIIDENVIIGNNVRLTNKDKHTHYDGDGVFVREGITIIASGTTLPDNFSF